MPPLTDSLIAHSVWPQTQNHPASHMLACTTYHACFTMIFFLSETDQVLLDFSCVVVVVFFFCFLSLDFGGAGKRWEQGLAM